MRLSLRPFACAALLGAFTLLDACVDHNGPMGPAINVPGITAVIGAGSSDTIQARLETPLVVEVRDSTGAAMSGVQVVFTSGLVTRPSGGQEYGAIIYAADNNYGWQGPSVGVMTDARGRAAVRVVLGTVAGDVVVKATVPTFNFATTIPLKVLPGRPSRVLTSPADTAINVGGTVAFRARVTDRLLNPLSDLATVAVHGSALTATGATTARGSEYGIAWAVATSGPAVDSARVIVLPKATIAAIPSAQYDGASMVIFNSDGTGRSVLTGFPGSSVITPYWSPSGDRLVCVVDGGSIYTIPASGATGAIRVGVGAWPQYSHDGAWIYYSSYGRIWKVKPDGTGATQVTPDGSYGNDQIASPDPTGSKMVYWTDRTSPPVAIFDFASGTTTATAATGGYARWSPRGDRIAVANSDGLWILDASGAKIALLPNGGGFWVSAEPVDWSPDGEWIIASGGGLEMIEASTLRVLPIPGTSGLAHPTWKP